MLYIVIVTLIILKLIVLFDRVRVWPRDDATLSLARTFFGPHVTRQIKLAWQTKLFGFWLEALFWAYFFRVNHVFSFLKIIKFEFGVLKIS